jgi:hypothetical protein
MKPWENRTLTDWAAAIALIPFLVSIFINLSDQSISEHYGTLLVKTDTDNSNLSIMNSGIAAIFSGIGFVFHALFWLKMTRIVEYVNVFPRVQARAIGFVALAGLLFVGFVAEGWIVFGIAQLAVAYTLYKAEVLPNGFGIITGVFAVAIIYFSAFGGASSDAPVFIFIAWSIVITAFSVSDAGHPEDRDMTIDSRIQEGQAEQAVAEENSE